MPRNNDDTNNNIHLRCNLFGNVGIFFITMGIMCLLIVYLWPIGGKMDIGNAKDGDFYPLTTKTIGGSGDEERGKNTTATTTCTVVGVHKYEAKPWKQVVCAEYYEYIVKVEEAINTQSQEEQEEKEEEDNNNIFNDDLANIDANSMSSSSRSSNIFYFTSEPYIHKACYAVSCGDCYLMDGRNSFNGTTIGGGDGNGDGNEGVQIPCWAPTNYNTLSKFYNCGNQTQSCYQISNPQELLDWNISNNLIGTLAGSFFIVFGCCAVSCCFKINFNKYKRANNHLRKSMSMNNMSLRRQSSQANV